MHTQTLDTEILGIVPGETGYFYTEKELIHPITLNRYDSKDALAESNTQGCYPKFNYSSILEKTEFYWDMSQYYQPVIIGNYLLRTVYQHANTPNTSFCYIGFKLFHLNCGNAKLVTKFYKDYANRPNQGMSGHYMITKDKKYFIIWGLINNYPRIEKAIIVRLSDYKIYEIDGIGPDVENDSKYIYDITKKIPITVNKTDKYLWTEEKLEKTGDYKLIRNVNANQWLFICDENTTIYNDNHYEDDFTIELVEGEIELTYKKDNILYECEISLFIKHTNIKTVEALYELLIELKKSTSTEATHSWHVDNKAATLTINFNSKYIEPIILKLNRISDDNDPIVKIGELQGYIDNQINGQLNKQRLIINKLLKITKANHVMTIQHYGNTDFI